MGDQHIKSGKTRLCFRYLLFVMAVYGAAGFVFLCVGFSARFEYRGFEWLLFWPVYFLQFLSHNAINRSPGVFFGGAFLQIIGYAAIGAGITYCLWNRKCLIWCHFLFFATIVTLLVFVPMIPFWVRDFPSLLDFCGL